LKNHAKTSIFLPQVPVSIFGKVGWISVGFLATLVEFWSIFYFFCPFWCFFGLGIFVGFQLNFLQAKTVKHSPNSEGFQVAKNSTEIQLKIQPNFQQYFFHTFCLCVWTCFFQRIQSKIQPVPNLSLFIFCVFCICFWAVISICNPYNPVIL